MPPKPATRNNTAIEDGDKKHKNILWGGIILGAINIGAGIFQVDDSGIFAAIPIGLGCLLIATGLLVITRQMWAYLVAMIVFILMVGMRILDGLATAWLMSNAPAGASSGVGPGALFAVIIGVLIYGALAKYAYEMMRGVSQQESVRRGASLDPDDEYGDQNRNWDQGRKR